MPAVAMADGRLRKHLLTRDQDWLVDHLLAAAAADPLLRARLEVAAGAGPHDAFDDAALEERLRRAIEIRDFVDYRSASSYFDDVGEALDAVNQLIDAGFPENAMVLAEYALELLEASAGLVDDSDGGLRVAIEQAEEIHLNACSAGKPDPVDLAERLVARALASDYEVFLYLLPGYEPVLGAEGMARYRQLVEKAWNDLPPKKPYEHSHRRFVVTQLMEQLAECTGGTDALIKVLARDVTSSYDTLRIAQRLSADGRDKEALEWLARGMAEFPPDPRLRSSAAACHVRAGRRAEAADLLWANFTDRPGLDTYVAMHDATADQFGPWRDRAMGVLRSAPATSARFTSAPYGRPAGRSVLVEVLLWEGDVDAAWQAAQDGGCRDDLWLRVARERATTSLSRFPCKPRVTDVVNVSQRESSGEEDDECVQRDLPSVCSRS
jgi:hypothetical protein